MSDYEKIMITFCGMNLFFTFASCVLIAALGMDIVTFIKSQKK